MNRALKKRTETALDELARTYELVRGLLIQRLEDIDTGTVRKRGSEYANKMASRLDDIDTKRLQRRGYKYAGALRKNVERRMRPEPRPRWPIAGLVVVGAALATVGWLMYDRSRREAMRQRLNDAQSRARERYADLGGVGGALNKVSGRTNGHEENLKSAVEDAISAGGTRPAGLEVSVEGRTVYLRGKVDDPAAVDAAAERIHSVPGVVAVVNLTTGSVMPGGTKS
jgi:BON domain-containing protein